MVFDYPQFIKYVLITGLSTVVIKNYEIPIYRLFGTQSRVQAEACRGHMFVDVFLTISIKTN